jgi:hypothetical protein
MIFEFFFNFFKLVEKPKIPKIIMSAAIIILWESKDPIVEKSHKLTAIVNLQRLLLLLIISILK